MTTPIWLWILLGIWALLLFGGAVLGRWNADRTHRMPTWARMASSLTLVLLAWLLYLHGRGGTNETYGLLIAIGMTCGFVGDLFMARLLPVREPVLGGMAAFALGHVIYIAAVLQVGEELALTA